MTTPTLTYVTRPTCDLPDLAPTTTGVADTGQTWTCPDCGREWKTVIQYATGAQLNTTWTSPRPAPTDWTPPDPPAPPEGDTP